MENAKEFGEAPADADEEALLEGVQGGLTSTQQQWQQSANLRSQAKKAGYNPFA